MRTCNQHIHYEDKDEEGREGWEAYTSAGTFSHPGRASDEIFTITAVGRWRLSDLVVARVILEGEVDAGAGTGLYVISARTYSDVELLSPPRMGCGTERGR